MPRGAAKQIGDRFTNRNNYTYVKTEKGWVPIHVLIAEEQLCRPLKETERAFFIDGDRTNHASENIGVKIAHGSKSPQARLLIVQASIADLEDRLEDLRKEAEELERAIAESEV